ncbi:uroporphyrinogen-III synthase [Microbacterium halotolerans]|uniref:uroporphyrinogen-III synthase n=1 Tax=Microbacterium halotolerans TaxID=246613 RepID=UPI000E6A954B|nr:uroporphyrinogen-III synthase [Microbacterium halotolerans]
MTTGGQLSAALDGCRIISTAHRRSSELAAALARHGAAVIAAPALTIVPHADDEALLVVTRELIASPPDVVVATTGVGFRGWVEAAHEADLADELLSAVADAQIVARGPKARGAIQQAGLTADWVAETETTAELGEYLVARGVAGLRVAVQHHGSGADGLDELLTEHGADVTSLTVYRWGPPADAGAVSVSTIAAAGGDADAVLFTSAPAAHAWLDAAEKAGALDTIRERAVTNRLLLASVGPITAGPLHRRDLVTSIAERGRLGSLVRLVVTHFGAGGAPSLATRSGRLELRSSGAVLDGTHLPLSPTSTSVLSVLFDAGGSVVTRDEIQGALPGTGLSPHAVDMAVARLRTGLGEPSLVTTVVKRGYRLDVEDSA